MSETPDNEAGRLTEQVMWDWTQKLAKMIPPEPRPNTTVYNAIYSSVYKTLSGLTEVK